MASESYVGEDLPIDAASKKFVGLRVDDGGTARHVAQEGVNLATVNGKRVANSKVQVGTELGAGATIGVTSDAAVSTDANGTVSAKLRGIIVLLVNFLSRLPAALTGSGNLKTALLEAIPAGTNNIGDVDVLTLPALPAGNNNIGDVDVATLPGTVATDITAIKTAVEVLDNAIAGSEMQVDVLTLPAVALDGATLTALETITVGTALPAGNANIGDVDIVTLPSGSLAASTKTGDFDTGGGTDTVHLIGLAVPGSGAAEVIYGSTTHGLDVDVTRLPTAFTTDVTGINTKLAGTLTTSQSLTAGAYLLIQNSVALDATVGGNAVPVPSAATYTVLTARGGDATYSLVGAASATQGVPLQDGIPVQIQAPPLLIRAFGQVGVTIVAEHYYDPNVARTITGFSPFWYWPGFSWPAAGRGTLIGNRTWTVLAGTWTVSDSASALANSVAPGSSGATNAIVFTGTTFYGWHWCSAVLAAQSDAGLVFGGADVSNYHVIRVYEATHGTKPNTVELITRTAGVESIIATYSSATLTAKGITLGQNRPIQISVLVALVGSDNRAYIYIDGIWLGSPPDIGTGFVLNYKTGVSTTTNGRFATVGQAAA